MAEYKEKEKHIIELNKYYDKVIKSIKMKKEDNKKEEKKDDK